MTIESKTQKTKRIIRNRWGVPSDQKTTDRDRFAALDRLYDHKWSGGIPANTLEDFVSEIEHDGLRIEE